jgi:hypothetical protein
LIVIDYNLTSRFGDCPTHPTSVEPNNQQVCDTTSAIVQLKVDAQTATWHNAHGLHPTLQKNNRVGHTTDIGDHRPNMMQSSEIADIWAIILKKKTSSGSNGQTQQPQQHDFGSTP